MVNKTVSFFFLIGVREYQQHCHQVDNYLFIGEGVGVENIT